MTEPRIFIADNFALQKGGVLPQARLVYQTLGELNGKRDNVVLSPTWYSGDHDGVKTGLIGAGRALDPAKYFIVIPNLLGGGLSSSPSNTPAPFDRGLFPRVTLYDNVLLQQMMLQETFGIERLKLVSSWSMGGCQSFQWAAQFPDRVEAIVPLFCSARTASFNKVFLLSLRRALELDPVFAEGFYQVPPIRGLKAFAAIYAGWGFSEPF
jgi:homoserine O-acetyltransferase